MLSVIFVHQLCLHTDGSTSAYHYEVNHQSSLSDLISLFIDFHIDFLNSQYFNNSIMIIMSIITITVLKLTQCHQANVMSTMVLFGKASLYRDGSKSTISQFEDLVTSSDFTFPQFYHYYYFLLILLLSMLLLLIQTS